MSNGVLVQEALTPGTFLHDVSARSYRDEIWIDRGCWGWGGSRNTHGYAVVRIPRRGEGSGTVKAHRLSYVIHRGPIPKGLLVLHSCDNPICTNPCHLRLGTAVENSRDRMERGRATRKVAPAVIDDLVRRILAGDISRCGAARSAGVDPRAVRGWVKARGYRASRGADHAE